jgi:hypothetical protein
VRRTVAAVLVTLFAATLCGTARAGALVGDQTIEPKADSNPAGEPEAFRYAAASGGQLGAISVYLDTGSTASTLTVGVYSENAGGHPAALLAQGSVSGPTAGAWNVVTLPPGASVTTGSNYWIALLGVGGTLRFRDRCCSGGSPAEVPAQVNVTTLAATWTTGGRFSDGPASVYASSSGITTPDTVPPTVSVTAPVAGATVSGALSVQATAADDVGVAGVQFSLDGANLGPEVTTAPYTASWDSSAAANGPHTLTAVARDAAGNTTTSAGVSVTVSNGAPPPAAAFLLGDQAIEPKTDSNPAGSAEAFKTTAVAGGTMSALSVYVDALSTATSITVGVYADASGHPGSLLAQGTLAGPTPGAWNDISVTPVAISSGVAYWTALLGNGGSVKFRDRCCSGGAPVEASSQTTLASLPATWSTGASYKDGPVSIWGRGSSSAGGPAPSLVGQWSSTIAWPSVAVHMALLPTGNVISWDGFADEPNSERLWNPASGAFTAVPYGTNIFCSGQIALADGRVLVVGGHVAAAVGLPDTSIFDPKTNTWSKLAPMTDSRWYPTATLLGDGRVFVMGGDNLVQKQAGVPHPFYDSSVPTLPEIYNPVTNTWTDLTAAKLNSPWYPFIFQLSDGRILDAGPDTVTRTITPAAGVWQNLGANSPFDGMSAVMYRPDKIMKAGSWADPDFKGALAYASSARTAVLDLTQPTVQWRETAPMNNARSYQNLTLLPDGTVFASGGMSTSDGVDLSQAVLPTEIWDPVTETWTTTASMSVGREYHSTALLLPDGRVLMAGGGQLPGSTATNEYNAQLYSPPYLFKGARPTITAAPSLVQYGSSFQVTTPDAARIAKVSLVRTPSVTHDFDQNQRFTFLNFTQAGGVLSVQAPAQANLAPPGYYMLFIVDTNGVPSVASFVRFPAGYEDTVAPTAPGVLTATGGTGSASLAWGAATDNVGVDHYEVYRSTSSGFTPTLLNRIATPAGSSYVDSGLAAGTYYYRVKAADLAGNLSPASNEAGGTATTDATPPTVSVTAPAPGSSILGSVSLAATAGDNVGVAGVQFRLDGANIGAEVTAPPYGILWDSTTAANGAHTLTR